MPDPVDDGGTAGLPAPPHHAPRTIGQSTKKRPLLLGMADLERRWQEVVLAA